MSDEIDPNWLPPKPKPQSDAGQFPSFLSGSSRNSTPTVVESPQATTTWAWQQRWVIGSVLGGVLLFLLVFTMVMNRESSDSPEPNTQPSATPGVEHSQATIPTTFAPSPAAGQDPEAHRSADDPATTVDQPQWDGAWVRNYWEDPGDCDQGVNYWVVQPGSQSGMYALKLGCFPPKWKKALDNRCQSSNLPAGRCAVWDKDSIMSEYRKHGDLLVVAITQACLDRAGLQEFHEGPLHQDCVVGAR